MRISDPGSRPALLSTTGGVDGLAASYAEMEALAALLAETGARLAADAGQVARLTVSTDLVATAPLSPGTWAEAEAALARLVAGPDSLTAAAVLWEVDAGLVLLSVASLREADEAVARATHALDVAVLRAVGLGAVLTAPVWVPAAAVTVGGAVVVGPHLPPSLRHHLAGTATTGLVEAQDYLAEHPALVQHGVDGSAGLLQGLLGPVGLALPPGLLATLGLDDVEHAAGLLSVLYPAGHAVVQRSGLRTAHRHRSPADLTGLVSHLNEVNDLSDVDHPEANGTVEVQTLTTGSGRRHVVYLPGTDEMTTLPWTADDDVRDLGTNLHLVHGDRDAYSEGIVEAMRQAGVRAGEPVLLVGHSQGGMAAVALLARGTPYAVTHVVTVGSPTAQVGELPAGTHVLSLETDEDVVPLTDGADNPDSLEQVTVRFHGSGAGVAGRHDITQYVAGAAATQASRDPSVQEAVRSLDAAGFLGSGARAEAQTFRITRAPEAR